MATATSAFAAHKDLLVVLATAGVVVPLMQRLKINPVLGFFAAGIALGPSGLGAFRWEFPLLRWITISDLTSVAGMAEFGVVFLMFLIGLELSFQRLRTMRRLVFGLGGLQVVVSGLVIALIAGYLGAGVELAVLMGAALALSSTAIVIEVLARQRRLGTPMGRASFSVLLMQDLAVVPILLLVSLLGGRAGGSYAVSELAGAVGLAVFGIIAIFLVGQRLLRPIFRMVAATESPELFMAATLFVVIGTGVLSTAAGLSMALGAFIAGLLLAETEYSRAIEATIEPFKGLLLGVFFFSVGLNVDLEALTGDPYPVILVAIGLMVVKLVLFLPLGRLFGLSWPAAFESGLLLAPCGEFAFVIIGIATTVGILDRTIAATLTAIVSMTMLTIPLFGMLGRQFTRAIERRRKSAPPELPPEGVTGHAIVAGHGRVGQVVVEMLERHGVPYLAVDRSQATVSAARRDRRQVYYGDIKIPGFLEACGIREAKAVIVTVSDPVEIDEIVASVRAMRPDIVIVSRARDAGHASHLYALGVTDAVPETIEASLQLSEASLVGIGKQTGPVIASIHEKRDEFRRMLQAASGDEQRRLHAVRQRTRQSE